MFRIHLILLSLGVLVYISLQVSCERTNKKIYIDINAISACFRRMNATHQIGCSSQRGGNVGVLHYVQTADDIAWLRDRGTAAPYAILITSTMFTERNINALMDTKKINSILVIYSNKTDAPQSFSADLTCPNDQYGIYHGDKKYGDCKKTEWNPSGTGLMFRDFPFPIVTLLNQTEVDILITQCYDKFNKPGADGAPRQYPLCSAQVKDEMDAAKDTPTCVRRSGLLQGLNPEHYCDPLGSYNVFAYTRPITFDNTTDNDSVIVAAARLDGFSMFNNEYFNSEGTVSGIVALLGAAYAIGKVTLPEDHKPIMFTFFNGEAYDYIGSSRMVYDMEHGIFPTSQKSRGDHNSVSPLSLSKLHSFLEVSQVAKPIDHKMWMHTDPLSKPSSDTRLKEMLTTLTDAGVETGLDIEKIPFDKEPLPPASLQTFLKKTKLSGVVIADHNTAYQNKYYNSRFDVPATMGGDYPNDVAKNATYDYVTPAAAHIQKVALTVAKTLYAMSTGQNDTSHIEVDNVTIANLLNCYLHRGNCELFQQVEEPGYVLRDKPYTYYVGVSMSYSDVPHNVTRYTHRILAYFLGEKLHISRDNCSQEQNTDATRDYTYMAGPTNSFGKRPGICVRSSANITLARSPAFDIDGYDWSSGLYSSWTESQWQIDAMMVRVFLVPSRQREIMTLCVGIGLFVFSLVLTFLLHKRAPVMFRPLHASL